MKQITEKLFLKAILLSIILVLGINTSFAQKDSSFYSNAFETERFYRIYLPNGYDVNSDTEYPVVYYFHGWSGRYKWDEYDLYDEWYDYYSDPVYQREDRDHPPFVMEWLDYSQNHDVIIVTWDGYEPNLHPGNSTREGIRYGGCQPYDYPRAHESSPRHWGWDFKMYFRDLVAHIDSNFNTKADRDHRAITGLSMGGLESLYITGQNKDLVGSASAFCPADVASMFGPKGHLSLFPVPEMYRSLKGVSMRITATDGDWLYAHDMLLKRIFEGSGFESFEFHEAHFPNHWAADIDKQLDYHMLEFEKIHTKPDNWSHICPSYLTFDQWGYVFNIDRTSNALTIVESVSKKHMKVFARKFIPDGPIVTNETVNVSTDALYTPSTVFSLNIYNMTSGAFATQSGTSTADGKLEFSLPGGGNIVGINADNMDAAADLVVVNKQNADYLYFEEGKQYFLDFTLVNVGNQDASSVIVNAISDHPYINFTENEKAFVSIKSATAAQSDSAISLNFTDFNEDNIVGNIMLKISVGGVVVDTQKIVFHAIPKSPYAVADDVIVLDGRSESGVPIFIRDNNSISNKTVSGGTGNGNGIFEAGEEVLVYVKLKQGLAPNDKNTYHRAYLIGEYENQFINVNKQKYDNKSSASATSTSSYITLSDSFSGSDSVDLWLRLESLYNEDKGEMAHRETYEFAYDYRRVKLATSGEGLKYSIQTSVLGSGSISISPADSVFDYGQEVVLTAVPDSGWSFNGWWGDFLGSTNPYNLTIEGNVSAVASFEQSTAIVEEEDIYKINVTPNPFTNTVNINYNLVKEGKVAISIYDMQGKKVRELKNIIEKPGAYSIEWDGRDTVQQSCPSGVYFYNMLISEKKIIRKIIKL